MLMEEVASRPPALAAVPEAGAPVGLGPPLGLTHSFITDREGSGAVAPPSPVTGLMDSRASSDALGSSGRTDTDPDAGTGAAGAAEGGSGQSAAFLLVLELIIDCNIPGDEAESSVELFSPEIVDLDLPDRFSQLDPEKEVLFYAQGGAPGSGFCFFLDNCTDEEMTTVRVIAPDVPGILASVTTAFEQEELDLVSCQTENLEGLTKGWSFLECLLLSDDGERIEDYPTSRKLCSRVRANLAARLQSTRRRTHNLQRNFKRGSSGGRRTGASGGAAEQAFSLSRKSMEPPGHGRRPSTGSEDLTAAARRDSISSMEGSMTMDVRQDSVMSTLSHRESKSDDSHKEGQLSRNSSLGSGSVLAVSVDSKPSSSFDVARMPEAVAPPVAPPPPPRVQQRTRSGLSEMITAADISAETVEEDADEVGYTNYRDTLVMHCMSGPLSVVKATTLVTVALKLMQECKKTCLVVDNGLGEGPGLVTKRDFLKAMKKQSVRGVTVGRLQSRPIHSIGVSERVRDAAKLMNKLQIRRLLVHDHNTITIGTDKTLAYIGEVTEDTLVDLSVSNSEHDSMDTPTGSHELERVQVVATAVASAPVVTRPVPVANYEDCWEIKFSELTLIARIGQGSFGEVWQGKWRGTDVAIKRVWGLHGSFEEAAHAATEFEREIAMLSQLRHPNVVMFLGACRVPPDIALVMEYCPRGTLHRLLHRSNVPLPLSLRIKMATHIARGMLALHSSLPRIIHRDLKTANLLVSASYEIKVCDFGLSRTMAHAAANCSNRSQSSFGTVEYAAPEVLRGEPYSERCDVWSFGVVLWELITRKRPYHEVTHSVSIIAGVSLGKLSLPPIPTDVADPGLAALVGVCCSQHPAARPSFVEILQYLEEEAGRIKSSNSGSQISSASALSSRMSGLSMDNSKRAGPSVPAAGRGSLPGQERTSASLTEAGGMRGGSAPETVARLVKVSAGEADILSDRGIRPQGRSVEGKAKSTFEMFDDGKSPFEAEEEIEYPFVVQKKRAEEEGESPFEVEVAGKSPFEADAEVEEGKSPFDMGADDVEGKSPFGEEAYEGGVPPLEAEDGGKSPFEVEAEEG